VGSGVSAAGGGTTASWPGGQSANAAPVTITVERECIQ